MFRFDEDVRKELRAHWPALLVAFCCLLFGFSAPAFALPFLFSEVIKEFGWTREQATLLASAKYLTGAIAALIVGRFIDTAGVRNTLFLTIGVGGLALVSFLWVPNLTFYYLSGVLLGFSGPGAMVAVKVLVSRTFHASQGTAMGFALLGTSLGAVIVPLIITALIGHFGWRVGMAGMSLGIWLIAMPMLFLGFFTRSMAGPDSFAEGVKPTSEQIAQRNADRRAARAASREALKGLIKHRSFWLIAGSVFAVSMVDQAFIQHQVLILDDMKVPREIAALAISAIGLVGIGCRVIVGNILDSTSHKGAAVTYFFLTISSLLAFLLGNPVVLFAYVVMRAAGHAAVLLDTTVLTKHAFGLKNYGTLIGIYTAIVSLGYATGPWLMGRMFDMSGSYRTAFIAAAIIPLVAAVLIWFMKPDYWIAPKRKTEAQPDLGAA